MKFGYKRLVIWGLRDQVDTYGFIHLGFYSMARKLGIETIWVENDPSNAAVVGSGDLVLSVGIAGSHMPIRKDVHYVLHNFQGTLDEKLAAIPVKNFITLQVFTNEGAKESDAIGDATYFSQSTRTLIQPWGTPLLAREFRRPPRLKFRKTSFWVGSVWNNELNQGNEIEYTKLKNSLADKGIVLKHVRTSEYMNRQLISRSVIAPAIGGNWQVEHGYMPCRFFKNVSFGQLGSTNIASFELVFGKTLVCDADVSKVVDLDLGITGRNRYDLISTQQELAARHTYDKKLQFMIDCLNS